MPQSNQNELLDPTALPVLEFQETLATLFSLEVLNASSYLDREFSRKAEDRGHLLRWGAKGESVQTAPDKLVGVQRRV